MAWQAELPFDDDVTGSLNSDVDFLLGLNDLLKTEPPPSSIAKWIANKRVLPQGTPFPGLWKNERTPFWVELMDDMSPNSPITFTVNMKAAQMGATAVMENIIGFYIGACPASILYVNAIEDLLKKWASKRLEPLIDSCELRELMINNTGNANSRRTGDKVLSKIFHGGDLDMASANSAPSLRADTKRIGLLDEIDGAREVLSTGEGSWLEVVLARLFAWGDLMKVIANSTPTAAGKSPIENLYLQGDQRKFLVPCPRCGKFQILRWGNENTQYGVKPIKEGGKLKDAYYLCEHCRDAFFNYEKDDFLGLGRWEPTSKSDSESMRSRHISGIYRPVGMRTWKNMYEKYDKVKDEPDKMRGFVNLDLGEPYKEIGGRPPVEHVYELRGGYKSGTIPDGVLFLTAAIDVQRGSLKDPSNPPRLEMEICGHGEGFRTWSILYKRFEGAIRDENEGAWLKLNEFAEEGGMVFERDDGMQFGVKVTFVDSGDGPMTDIIYRFCDGWSNTFPSKGFNALKAKKGEASDPMKPNEFFIKYRQSKVGATLLFTISTVYYKEQLYKNLRKTRRATGEQLKGFCEFPVDYPNKYFKMLTAEERLSDGSYEAYGRRNEALDCFDNQTELLTSEGWKGIHEVCRGLEFATINMSTNEIEYQKPSHIVRREHHGEMIQIKGRRIDILVTPNHRMVTYKKEMQRQYDGKRKWNFDVPPKITLAKDLTIHHQLKLAGEWVGEQRDVVVFEGPFTGDGRRDRFFTKKVVDASVWAAFLGIYVSEGCKGTVNHKNKKTGYLQRMSRVQIDQNEGEEAEKIREIISQLPWKFHERMYGNCVRWMCTNSQLQRALDDYGAKCGEKRIGDWLKQSDSETIGIFLDYAIMGDGWVQTKPGQRLHRSYATVSKRLADDMQELFLKIGVTANIRTVNPAPFRYDGKVYDSKTQYHVSECKTQKASLDGGAGGARRLIAETVEYSGDVFCATVPNGTLIARRNGKAFVAGNCRVYNLCAADIYLKWQIEQVQAYYKKKGLNANALKRIDHKFILDGMTERTKRRIGT
jgi:phage terminase large subunit GpA-like protein